MTVSLRVYTGSTDDASGYVVLRVDGEDVGAFGPRFVAVHRLAAVGWGVLDSLADEREIHHRDGVPSHNAEANLDALAPEDHGRETVDQVRRRTATDGGER